MRVLSYLWLSPFPTPAVSARGLRVLHEEWVAESSWREELVSCLPWAHLAYNQFKSRLQNFSRILAVYPRVIGYLLKQEGCRIPRSEMVESLPGILGP